MPNIEVEFSNGPGNTPGTTSVISSLNGAVRSVKVDGERFVREVVPPATYKLGDKVKVKGVLDHKPKHPLGTGRIVQLVKDFDRGVGIVLVRFGSRTRRAYTAGLNFTIESQHNLKVVSE